MNASIFENKILKLLREEKECRLSGGLYHELQVRMTYNSNNIEGSRLSEEQTRLIFETNTVDAGDGIPVDDILEHDTKGSTLSWFAVGDYKKRPNIVGGKETVKPKDVHTHMQNLLSEYNAKENVTINNIIALHAEFEYIHPFQDGNGRVGRLVAFKECLRHNIIPFIIEDRKKNFYIQRAGGMEGSRTGTTSSSGAQSSRFRASSENRRR